MPIQLRGKRGASTRKTFLETIRLPMPDSRVPVIALGIGITLLGVIRVLRRANVPTYSVASGDDFVRWSRAFRGAPGPPPTGDSQREFEAFLEQLPFERAVLIGCSDVWAARIAALPAALRERFPASSCSGEVVEIFVDKLRFAQTAVDAGVTIPLTVPVDAHRPPGDEVFEEGRTLFLKPRDSVAFLASYGVKAFWANSPAEFRERLAFANADGHEMVLQEYVLGPPTNHFFIDGFVDAGGRITAMLARQRLRMYPEDFGNSSSMITIALDEVPEACDALDRLLTHAKYRGVFSAEFKRDARDGRCCLLEVNPRPWWYVDFAARCGVDVCTMAYDDALGRPVSGGDRYEIGRSLIYPRLDWLASREMRRAGSISTTEYLWALLVADHPVHAWDDPLPGFVLGANSLKKFVSGRLRALRARRSPTAAS